MNWLPTIDSTKGYWIIYWLSYELVLKKGTRK